LLTDGASIARGNTLRNNGTGDIAVGTRGGGSYLAENTVSVAATIRAPLSAGDGDGSPASQPDALVLVPPRGLRVLLP
jgi:hypothetical protein